MASSSWALLLSLWIVAAVRATGEVTTTMAHGDCVTVFKAETKSDTFEESCETITFPCIVEPGAGYYAVPDNCAFYYRCVIQSVLRCSSPTDTGFDIALNTLVHKFDANCTCPNGVKSKTWSTRKTTTVTPTSQNETGGIVGGVLALVVIVIIVIVIVIVLRRKNQARLSQEDKNDVCRVDPMQDKNGVCRVNSIQSDTYDELDEVEPQYDNNAMAVANRANLSTLNRGPLPEVPDVDAATDDMYLQLRRLTDEIPAGDAENTTLADGDRNMTNATDSVYLTPVTADSGDGNDSVGSITNGRR